VDGLVGLALLAGGLVLVVGGAELFFDGLVAAAARFRLSPFVLTVVVSGFELENLAAGIAANAKGLPNAAAGTFLGGTTFLALAVTGAAALASPLRTRLPGATVAWTAVSALPLLALGLDGVLSRLDGAVLLVWFLVALVGIARSGRGLHGAESPAHARLSLLRLVGGLAVLTAGGELLGSGLHRVVARFGISESLLGNTAVAASVEAEEVGRVVVPARRGRADVALGNVVGTVVHFVGLNAGLIALVRPLELDAPSRHLHLPVAVASTLVLAAVARRGPGRLAGAALLVLYAAYVAVAVVTSL
jgi:cation:H+ antiporter